MSGINAALDVCAKTVLVWGKRKKMRGLLLGEKLSWICLLPVVHIKGDDLSREISSELSLEGNNYEFVE